MIYFVNELYFIRYYLNQTAFILIFDNIPIIVKADELEYTIYTEARKNISTSLLHNIRCLNLNDGTADKICVFKEIIIIILIFFLSCNLACLSLTCCYKHYAAYNRFYRCFIDTNAIDGNPKGVVTPARKQKART